MIRSTFLASVVCGDGSPEGSSQIEVRAGSELERAKGKRTDEVQRVVGEDWDDVHASVEKSTTQINGLVGRDPAAHSNDDSFPRKIHTGNVSALVGGTYRPKRTGLFSSRGFSNHIGNRGQNLGGDGGSCFNRRSSVDRGERSNGHLDSLRMVDLVGDDLFERH